ncbi:MAG: TRAM domain-containing protein, partial [Christensenellales bacterium]
HALHLPVQHGSNRILQSMNRRYTREKYLERVEAIRAKVPDISLTTDLIVGYPGETEEEFEETCSLVERVGYDSAFTFIYSPRVGTRAADMPDQIPESVSSRRIQKLIALQKEITHKRYAKYIGQVHNVLVEEASRRDENQMAGKNEYNITVNFPGDKSLVGQIVKVRITSAGESTLRGERVD